MHTSFLNCRLCINGELVEKRLVVSQDDGLILQETGFIGGEAIDLEDGIIAPGFLELQTNGVNGFHFSGFEGGRELGEAEYRRKLDEVGRFYVSRGVTGFWATVPTVSSEVYPKILTRLAPRGFDGRAAALLGAHVEGPYLAAGKKGAHNASLFKDPSSSSLTETYGSESALANVKLATLAPELPESSELIREFRQRGVKVSLGHSTATYDQGLVALEAGANCLTHTMNAMAPLHHRDPGLAGLITLPEPIPEPAPFMRTSSSSSSFFTAQTSRSNSLSYSYSSSLSSSPASSSPPSPGPKHHLPVQPPSPDDHDDLIMMGGMGGVSPPYQSSPPPPYFSILADGHHVHPSVATMLHRSNPAKSILISDSIELAGLPDGTYAGHAQIPFNQVKRGVVAHIEDTSTLIGSCISVDEAVRNLMRWSGCSVAQAVRCVTENVASFMGLKDRGFLREGMRADFVVLSDDGFVLETWIGGRRVWSRREGYVVDDADVFGFGYGDVEVKSYRSW